MVGQIVDQYGNPVSTADLSREIAAPQEFGRRRVIEDTVASGMGPENLAAILLEAARGDARRYLTLAEEMEERYLHYASQVQTRRLAIKGVERTVSTPDGVPAKIIDAVNELVEGRLLRRAMAEATDGIAKGYAVSEVMWEYERKALQPVAFLRRDQRFFTFDRVTHERLMLLDDIGYDGVPLDHAKYVVHIPLSKAGIPIRRGFARAATWAFMIQSFALKDWAAFSEIYGVPFRVGRYGKQASDKDKRSLMMAVRAIANDAAAIVPQGTDIEFHKVEGSHGASVFGELLDYTDKQVSKLILGQTMTSDDGSSMAQAKVHNDVRLDIVEADCEDLAETINRDVIEPFVAMNFGVQEVYPALELNVPKPEDVKSLTEAVARLVPLGFRVDQRELRDRIGLSDPGPDAELLVAPSKPVQEPVKTPSKPANLAGKTSNDAVDTDRMMDDILANAGSDWTALTDPLLSPLAAILDGAGSLEEARAMFEAVAIDGTPLADELAKATAKARGLGDVSDGADDTI